MNINRQLKKYTLLRRICVKRSSSTLIHQNGPLLNDNRNSSQSLSILEEKLAALKDTSLIGLSSRKNAIKGQLPKLRSELSHKLPPQTLDQGLSLIYACLQNNRIDEAERRFNRLWWSNNDEFGSLFDIKLINYFIEAHLEAQKQLLTSRDLPEQSLENGSLPSQSSHIHRATLWLKRIGEFGLYPNARTFGLFISYYLERGQKKDVLQILQLAKDNAISPDDFLALDMFLDKESRHTLEVVLQESGFNLPLDNESDVNHLLGSALDDIQQNNPLVTSDSDELSAEDALIAQLKSVQLAETQVGSVPILRRLLEELQTITGLDSYGRQQWLEERSFAAAKEVFETQRGNLPASLTKIVELPVSIMSDWQMKLERVIKSKIKSLSQSGQEQELLELLTILSPDILSHIAVVEFFQAPFLSKVADNYKKGIISENDAENQVMIRELAVRIANSLEREVRRKHFKSRKKNESKDISRRIHDLHTKGKLFEDVMRKAAQVTVRRNEALNEPWSPSWDATSRLNVGTWLIKTLEEVAEVQVDMAENGKPKFARAFQLVLRSTDKMHQSWFIVYHPKLFDIASHSTYNIDPWQLPMLTRPRPWITIHNGGYLQQKGQVMRLNGNIEHAELVQEADNQNHLNLVLKALDVLGCTAWKINARVLEVAIAMWNSGQDAPYMPSISQNGDDADEKKRLREKMSQRCDTNYKMEIAKAFLGETIYFPHNLDFRGRAYPVPTHLNHMGSDLCRGLLMFARGKELGEEGLKWLKIHLSNLAGCDKVSHNERIAFTESHLEDIMDSADNPSTGKKWWLKGDDPWQLLAACIELSSALRSPNPKSYVSCLPIHQDGSCNGLQHYAALGGDPLGAKSVNLISSDAPNDVYSDVARVVKASVQNDANNGHKVAQKINHLVNRKLVKQTVMTSTYGVTFIGARDQVAARIREMAENPNDITPDELREWSLYLTKIILDSIGTLFEGAQALQKWLNMAARTVASSIHVEDIPVAEMQDSDFIIGLGILNDISAHEDSSETNIDDLIDAAQTDLAFDDAIDPREDMVDDILQEFDLTKASDRLVLGAKGASAAPMKLTSVVWTTPLGLPIAQPYRKFRTFTVRTHLQSFQVFDKRTRSPVNSRKQSTAFPPNFIHSLDASHMMLAALKCQQKGIEFAAVHDSFWTHACDVPIMSHIIRETFVRLHQSPLLENLRNELIERFKHHKLSRTIHITDEAQLNQIREYFKSKGKRFIVSKKKGRTLKVWVDFDLPPLPPRGDLDLTCVLSSPYFFH